MRRLISSKSHTCTESVDVDVPEISGKVNAHYPGRSGILLAKRPEVSRRHSRHIDRAEGRNVKERETNLTFDMTKETQNSMAEMPEPKPEGSGRKLRSAGVGASSVTTSEGNV